MKRTTQPRGGEVVGCRSDRSTRMLTMQVNEEKHQLRFLTPKKVVGGE